MTEEIQNAEELAEPAPASEEQIQDEAQIDGSEQKPEEAPADDDAGAPRNNKGAERRIRQLTRKFREEERKNQDLVARLDALEKRVPVPEDPRPKRDEFDTLEEYEDAVFDWRDSKRESKPETTEQPAAQSSTNEIQDAFEAEIEEIDPDMVEEVMDGDWPCTQVMTDFIMTSEQSAKLAIHLATNPDIADKISKLSPLLAARELTKVEGNLSSNNKPGAPDTAPPPMETGKPSGAVMTDPDKMSTDQWVAERRRQLEAR